MNFKNIFEQPKIRWEAQQSRNTPFSINFLMNNWRMNEQFQCQAIRKNGAINIFTE